MQSDKISPADSPAITPKVELRVSENIYKKMHKNEKSKSILSVGGINLDDLAQISENFNMAEFTNNSLKESMEKIQTNSGIKESKNKFQSGNKLFLILKKLREEPGKTLS